MITWSANNKRRFSLICENLNCFLHLKGKTLKIWVKCLATKQRILLIDKAPEPKLNRNWIQVITAPAILWNWTKLKTNQHNFSTITNVFTFRSLIFHFFFFISFVSQIFSQISHHKMFSNSFASLTSVYIPEEKSDEAPEDFSSLKLLWCAE